MLITFSGFSAKLGGVPELIPPKVSNSSSNAGRVRASANPHSALECSISTAATHPPTTCIACQLACSCPSWSSVQAEVWRVSQVALALLCIPPLRTIWETIIGSRKIWAMRRPATKLVNALFVWPVCKSTMAVIAKLFAACLTEDKWFRTKLNPFRVIQVEHHLRALQRGGHLGEKLAVVLHMGGHDGPDVGL